MNYTNREEGLKKIIDLMDTAIKGLNRLNDDLYSHKEEDAAINIIIDNQDENGMIFSEIENDNGESLKIGEEMRTPEGFRRIRINTADIINHCNIWPPKETEG